jgi:CubicO group peptidase (beta-lactamase class C family)
MSTRREFIECVAKVGAAAAALPLLPKAMAADSTTPANSQTDTAANEYARSLELARAAAGVTGASFAYYDGKTLHTAVAGMRNSVTRDPVTVDTVMHTGSITKVMNATLVMQLVDEGKIALDDPVPKHLPEFRLRDMQALQLITCRMLLNHTSGIDGEWLPEFGPDQERIVDTIHRCADLGQLFAPGEEVSYNNVATVVAGYLAQKLRHESWYTLVKSRIYEPLGMQHSLVYPLEVPRFRASIGDLTDAATGELVQTKRPFLAPSFAPAGSTQMATAMDLVTFARALMNGGVGTNGNRILSAESAKRMMEPTAEFVPIGASADKVGLGWMILPGDVVGHGGGGPGVRANLFAHPASGRAVALLTNCDKGAALISAFLDPILQSWTGIKPSIPQTTIGPVDPAPYVGIYENNVDRYIISSIDGGLALRIIDKIGTFDNSDQEVPATSLFPVGNDTFEGKAGRPGGADMAIRFVRPGPDGQMKFLATAFHLLARVVTRPGEGPHE